MALYNIYLSPPSIPGSSACREKERRALSGQRRAGLGGDGVGYAGVGWSGMRCRRGPAPPAAGRRAGGSLPSLRLHPRTVIANRSSKQEELKSTKMAEAVARLSPASPLLPFSNRQKPPHASDGTGEGSCRLRRRGVLLFAPIHPPVPLTWAWPRHRPILRGHAGERVSRIQLCSLVLFAPPAAGLRQ